MATKLSGWAKGTFLNRDELAIRYRKPQSGEGRVIVRLLPQARDARSPKPVMHPVTGFADIHVPGGVFYARNHRGSP